MKNFDSIKFKMAAYQPLFTFTWPIFGKPCLMARLLGHYVFFPVLDEHAH